MIKRLKKEMAQYLYNSNFLSEYELIQRKKLRIYDILIAIIAGIAAVTSLINEMPSFSLWANSEFGNLLPTISILIVFLSTIIKYFLPKIIPNESRMMKISEIQEFYTSHYNLLEKLWYEFKGNRIKEKKLTDEFYKIIEHDTKMAKQINEVVKSIPKKADEKARQESTSYLKLIS